MNSLVGKLYPEGGDAKAPELGVLDEFTPLLTRVVVEPTDIAAQSSLLFSVQGAWFAKGAEKKTFKEIFLKMHSLGYLSTDAMEHWKEDTINKTKGKMKALIQVC